MKRSLFIRSAAVILILCFAGSYALLFEADALSDKLIRLHVIANSDEQYDQELKLRVRDSVLDCLSDALDGASDREEARVIIEERLPEIRAAAEKAISAAGYDYPVYADIGFEDYPTREYENLSLPAGRYLSLRVTVGSGEGKNWWCVVFPPVCTAAAASEDLAVMDFTSSEIALMTGKDRGYVIKFRLIEFLEELRRRIEA